ncbi:galactose-3-O-sulfotransferase 2-like [Haliotis asinina]|uniref:galactose-3-O-sulfotransferase 2-like n=1 Tax=Haliotis asinina TaxID=109174 RepID=UPI0035324B81
MTRKGDALAVITHRVVNPSNYSMPYARRKSTVLRLFLQLSVVAVILVFSISYSNFREAFTRNTKVPMFVNSQCICDKGIDITHRVSASQVERENTASADLQKHRRYSSEVRHIAFLKVHKCASSTMLNIFYRFGYKRGLNFVLPIQGNYLHMTHQKGLISVVPPPAMSGYDILCNHVTKFSKEQFSRYLPPDSKYIAIVREPFQRMYSAFHYYRNVLHSPILRQVTGLDPFKTYLNNITSLETMWGDHSYTNNKMARDFGFPTQDYKNITKFKMYLETLDKQFHLVMVSEMFLESLVLLRRLLKWSMEDVIFLQINVHEHKHLTTNASSVNIEPFLALDRILYDHCLTRLKEQIISEGPDFHKELQYFKDVNSRVTDLCSTKNTTKKLLPLKANEWHDDFTITLQDCAMLRKPVISFLNFVRDIQTERIQTFGANISYFQ